jgi:hypothetical protein
MLVQAPLVSNLFDVRRAVSSRRTGLSGVGLRRRLGALTLAPQLAAIRTHERNEEREAARRVEYPPIRPRLSRRR